MVSHLTITAENQSSYRMARNMTYSGGTGVVNKEKLPIQESFMNEVSQTNTVSPMQWKTEKFLCGFFSLV